jgi:RNA polymerase sporulation-specific sigma factor
MYKETDDNELLYLTEENNEEAFTELIDRYSPKIHAIIGKYKQKAFQVGLDISDLYQEGLIGLINAIKTYNKEREASFKTYAVVLIERELLDLIKRNDRNKDKTLNNAISLDNFSLEEKQSLYNIIEIDNFTPELRLINEEITEEVKTELTEFELKVYELKIDGKTNREISLILEKSTRSIENTIQRIKLKIKEKMNV